VQLAGVTAGIPLKQPGIFEFAEPTLDLRFTEAGRLSQLRGGQFYRSWTENIALLVAGKQPDSSPERES